MRSPFRILLCVLFISALGTPLLRAEGPACSSSVAVPESWAQAADLGFIPEPISRSSCTVTLHCPFTLQPTISCSSSTGDCHTGQDNNGWVECDGARTYCPPTPPCTGTCYSGPQCYAICSEVGDPMLYPCDFSAHCCRCNY